MFPALSMGIFLEYFFINFSSFLEKPVVPITTLFFNFEAILSTSRVHFGTVKSIITLAFLNAFFEFNLDFKPDTFLLIILFSVTETSLKFLILDGLYLSLVGEKKNVVYPQFSDHYFTGDYPIKPSDKLKGFKVKQLSLLSGKSNN